MAKERECPGPGVSTPVFLGLVGVIALVALVIRGVDLTAIPPGLHFDQAANGLLGLEILTGRSRPVFFSSYTGREALFMYVIAGLSALIGPGVVALRLAGSLCGVAGVIAVAFLGASLFNRRIGLLASAMLAGLYCQIHISRLGERTIMVPLLDTLALLAVWEAFRHRSNRGQAVTLALVGGGLTGLQLYTYPSSRFFLPVLGAIAFFEGVGLIIVARRKGKLLPSSPSFGTVALLTGIVVVAAVVVTIPLALHFYHVPADFLGRANEVAIWNTHVAGPSPWYTLATSILRTVGMFVVMGDRDWKYNLAGRPVFDPVSAVFFLLGLGLALWRWRSRAERACLIWMFVMLVPGFLSVGAPQFMRTLGAIPPAVVLVALGLDAVARRAQQSTVLMIRRGAPALWGWPVVAGALAVYQYFGVWAPSAAAYLALEGDVTAAAGVIQQLSPKYASTYVASRYGPDPTESFLDGQLFARLHWFDGRSALPMPPPGSGPTLYVLPRTATAGYWYDRIPASDRVARVMAPDHGPAVEAFVLGPDSLPPKPGTIPLAVDFGGVARLVGAEIPPSAPAGSAAYPTLYWQIEKQPSEDLKFFVHLTDATGHTWAQYDENVYPAAEWHPGQRLIVRQKLAIPDDVPVGSYTLQVGIEQANGTALSANAQGGHADGNFWRSPPLAVTRPSHPPALATLPIQHPLNAVFGDAVRLAGASITPSTLQDGDSAQVTLFWEVARQPSSNLQTEIQVLGSNGAVVYQQEHAPTGGVWPAQDWRAGDVVVDRQTVLVPAGTPAGSVALKVGLRDEQGHMLQLSGQSTPLVAIGSLLVKERPRSAVTVSIPHRQEVAFQGGIQLVGYGLSSTSARPGQTVKVTLYWKADHPVDRSWTVFTHILDSHSQIQAQHDGIPDEGKRPTTTWAPGETIVDPHTLVVQPDAKAGTDRLEVGLYDAATGRRLDTVNRQNRVLLDTDLSIR